jgi:predicted RNA binding protein YcfA (HicA-like mRNA interferase family)
MSPKLPVISGVRCVEALRKVGFEVDRQRGSHMILVRIDPPATISVPNHKELDRGLLRAILRQAGLTVDDFLDLL